MINYHIIKLLCARTWLVTSASFTNTERTEFNLVSGCYHYQGTACQNLQFIYTCLVFCPEAVIYLVTRGSCQPSVNHPSFRLADSLSTIIDVWPHIQYMFSILFTHWQTFNPWKHISTPCWVFRTPCNHAATLPCKTAAPAKIILTFICVHLSE